jgi:hypothetical protein
MSCSSPDHKPDWNAYALAELDPPAQRQAEAHAAACADCREELAALRLTLDTLSTLREEEIPRRIAFVSDKVFEPKWWQRIFSPTFAAAGLVAAAILVHAFVGTGAAGGVDETQLQARVDAAVNQAMEQAEARHAQEMLATYELLDKQFKQMYITTFQMVRQ